MGAALLKSVVAISLLSVGCITPPADYVPSWEKSSRYPALQARCHRDEAEACYVLAETLALNDDKLSAENVLYLRRIAELACRLGKPDGCTLAAMTIHYYKQFGIPLRDSDIKHNVWLWNYGCKQGSWTTCWAIKFFEGEPAEYPSAESVFKNLTEACARHADSCHHLAILMIAGVGAAADPAGAVALLRRKCAVAVPSCRVLAALYGEGKLLPYDAQQVAWLCARVKKASLDEKCPDSFSDEVHWVLAPLTPGVPLRRPED
jgi:hypothetical protein